MVPQLSTTDRDSQPPNAIRFHYLANQMGKLCLLGLLTMYSALCAGQDTDLGVRIEPLTAIDQQFMSDQRVRVEQLANRLGRNLSGQAIRDIDTLQRLLDDGLVPSTDTLSLQAMGVVFGDLLGSQLGMRWIVYRDNAGRSRALSHRDTDVTLFPMTMISRRYQSGSTRRLQSLYDETVANTRPQLPGGKWLP